MPNFRDLLAQVKREIREVELHELGGWASCDRHDLRQCRGSPRRAIMIAKLHLYAIDRDRVAFHVPGHGHLMTNVRRHFVHRRLVDL